mmetsp:Transcript_120586/g.240111  ORF Transcript_120586/g.240111 Transcript_120586/m.240111 type:complete len:345 (+) Transcript_120586:103-1137(+)
MGSACVRQSLDEDGDVVQRGFSSLCNLSSLALSRDEAILEEMMRVSEKNFGPNNLGGHHNATAVEDNSSKRTISAVAGHDLWKVPSALRRVAVPADSTKESLPQEATKRTPVPVELHIYNIGTCGGGKVFNKILRPLGTGAFHCGVQVYEIEYGFSDTTSRKEKTGIFRCLPRRCSGHTYDESVPMGATHCSQEEVQALIECLQQEWLVSDYDVLRRNCCHFASDLCCKLGLSEIPKWVTNLAEAGVALEDSVEQLQEKTRMACAVCCTTAEHRREALSSLKSFHSNSDVDVVETIELEGGAPSSKRGPTNCLVAAKVAEPPQELSLPGFAKVKSLTTTLPRAD